MIKKNLGFTLLIMMLMVFGIENVSATNVNGERIDWNNKITMAANKNVAYMIHDGCEYTVSIPNAVNKLMYPSGMTNPLILYQTTTYQHSKMDFYQIYDTGIQSVAYTTSWRKNSSGNYYAMPTYEKDMYDWVYAEITLNDAYMDPMTNQKRAAIIIHEMLHGFGLKDLYSSLNKNSIMYGYSSGTATGVTSDANQILNDKYN